MRTIFLAKMDKTRPVLLLTRESVRPYLSALTVAPITSTVRGVSSEVPVGVANGLDHEGVISCDTISTIPVRNLGRPVGFLLPAQELALARAIIAAFDLLE
ncbi:MAG: type II toxin-antitoxin system PemK/MazF family toxin [Angustibacter sp.]